MLKMVETFSGIGAQVKALKRMNIKHEILNTADWDINAIIAYDYIHYGNPDTSKFDGMTKFEIISFLSKFTLSYDGKKPISESFLEKQEIDFLRRIASSIDRTKNLVSVVDIHGEDLPDDMNILTYSFPCQDLSLAGQWHGNKGGIDRNANNRSSMLWQIERILIERKDNNKKLPKFLLMENVRNIMSKQHLKNFSEWQESLRKLGYENYIFPLDASYFGVPQKRVRAYMISVLIEKDEKLRKKVDNFFKKNDLKKLSENGLLNKANISIKEILKVDYSNPIIKSEADCSTPNRTVSRLNIYRDNYKLYDEKNHLYPTKILPTLTTKQDRHPNSGVIDYDNNMKNKCKFRYLTPREGFLLMGFDEKDYEILINNNFKINKHNYFFTRDKLNKMAGNSIVVNVLEEIFKQIEYINDNILND